jgi:hypothetical protein
MIDLLNTNAGAINALVAILTVILTAVVTRLTHLMVNETRLTRESQTEPQLAVYAEDSVSIHFKDFVVRNIGRGPAYRIRFEILNDLECEKGKMFSSYPFISSGINYLAPEQKFSFFLTSLLENFDEKIASPLRLKVFYYNKIGTEYSEEFTLDFSSLKGTTQLSRKDIEDIAREMELIRRDINHLATGFRKIHVVIDGTTKQ